MIKVPGIQFPVRTLFLACKQLPSGCVLTWLLLSACVKGGPWSFSSSYEVINPEDKWGPTLITSLLLNDLLIGPVSTYSHIGYNVTSTWSWRDTNIQPITASTDLYFPPAPLDSDSHSPSDTGNMDQSIYRSLKEQICSFPFGSYYPQGGYGLGGDQSWECQGPNFRSPIPTCNATSLQNVSKILLPGKRSLSCPKL